TTVQNSLKRFTVSLTLHRREHRRGRQLPPDHRGSNRLLVAQHLRLRPLPLHTSPLPPHHRHDPRRSRNDPRKYPTSTCPASRPRTHEYAEISSCHRNTCPRHRLGPVELFRLLDNRRHRNGVHLRLLFDPAVPSLRPLPVRPAVQYSIVPHCSRNIRSLWNPRLLAQLIARAVGHCRSLLRVSLRTLCPRLGRKRSRSISFCCGANDSWRHCPLGPADQTCSRTHSKSDNPGHQIDRRRTHFGETTHQAILESSETDLQIEPGLIGRSYLDRT